MFLFLAAIIKAGVEMDFECEGGKILPVMVKFLNR